MMDLSTVLLAGLVVCLCGAAQGAVGFGYALFATPLLLRVGLSLDQIVPLIAMCSAVQASLGTVSLRKTVPWRLVGTAALLITCTSACGLLILRHVVRFPAATVEALVGLALCVLVLADVIGRRVGNATPSRRETNILAFTVSGLLFGICGMGGPPLVLWALRQNWSPRQTRGTLFAIFALTLPLQIPLMWLVLESNVFESSVMGLILTPFVVIGARLGLPLGNLMTAEMLRRVAYALLLLIGVIAMLGH